MSAFESATALPLPGNAGSTAATESFPQLCLQPELTDLIQQHPPHDCYDHDPKTPQASVHPFPLVDYSVQTRPPSLSLQSTYSESTGSTFSDLDSRRASFISAASEYAEEAQPDPSHTRQALATRQTLASGAQPLTRSRRHAKQLHAARLQRSGSTSLVLGSDRDHRDRPDRDQWDWSGRRGGHNGHNRSSGSQSPSASASSRRGTVSSTVSATSEADSLGAGLTRMAFAEQQRWIKVQEKTFTKWLNTKLQERELEVKDLVSDLSDGVMLIHLLECLSSESLGRYAAKPKMRVQRFENANLSLNFIKSRGIQMTNIGAEDVVDGNRKIILGLIWTLILRFTISDIHEEGMTAKEGLLLWCQRKTACYDEVEVRDFSASWNDGLAFCALLDIHRPDLIDYDSLDKSDRRGNMQLAFDLAHEEIGIPKLLDVEDVCDVAKPDERSLMTYIAYWFHAFSQMEKVENAGRRVEKFVNNMQGAWEMQSAYERRMAELLRQVRAQQASWRAATFAGTYTDAKAQAADFASYKRGQKRAWVAEKSELATLLGNIKTKLGTYRLRPYAPPPELCLDAMDREWAALTTAEMGRGQLINETIRDIKNALRRSFADKANDFALALNTVQLAISGLEGDVEDQLHHVRKLSENLPPLDAYLDTIGAVDAQCEEANIEENDFTTYTYDELSYELGLAKTSVAKKLAFLENQMVARNMTNLTPIQLEEFESVFRHFDRDDSNALQELEFSAALASLGLVFSEDEMHEYFVAAAQHRDRVTFEQFIRFMVDVTEDQNTAEQVFQSFREVADGKPYVTEMDLRHSLVPDEVIDQLVAIMPAHQGPDLAEDRGTPQYDYITFMDRMISGEGSGSGSGSGGARSDSPSSSASSTSSATSALSLSSPSAASHNPQLTPSSSSSSASQPANDENKHAHSPHKTNHSSSFSLSSTSTPQLTRPPLQPLQPIGQSTQPSQPSQPSHHSQHTQHSHQLSQSQSLYRADGRQSPQKNMHPSVSMSGGGLVGGYP